MKKTKNKPKKTESYHHGDLRSALIQCAVDLLKTKSPADLTLRELARKTNVSTAAPFRHFKDRKELLAAISRQGFEIQYQYMRESFDNSHDDLSKMYLGCGKAYFKMGLKHPQHFKLMYGSEVVPCHDYPELAEAALKTFQIVTEVVKFCQQKKFLGPGDPYKRAMQYWAVVHGLTSLYADGQLGFLGVENFNAEMMLEGLLEHMLLGTRSSLEDNSKKARLFQTDTSQEALEKLKNWVP